MSPPAEGPTIQTDVLIVGGGVSGCATAYYLSREGVDVVLIERDDINAGASGRNAGSLHLQLMAFIFRRVDAEERTGRQAVLPMYRAAIETWRELSGELDCDIELRTCGGLMVAESDAHMRFLADKIDLERAQGLDVHMLSRSEVRDLAPYLSDRVVGAEFCPGEGKLNPILAVPALARAAERHGARIQRHTRLMALIREGAGFKAETDRGPIICHRVVNAAGPWSPTVATMVGVALPVEQRCVLSNVTEAAPPLIGHLVCHAERILTLKQVANGNIIIGGGWPAILDRASGYPMVSRRQVEANLWTAHGVVPSLARLRLLRSWAGVNIASDGRPILGEVTGVKGFYNAVPTDAGLTMGPVCARLLAEQMTGRPCSVDIGPYSIDRFSKVA